MKSLQLSEHKEGLFANIFILIVLGYDFDIKIVRIYANIKQKGSEVFGIRWVISDAQIHFIGSKYSSAAQIQTYKPNIIGAGSYVKLC